MTQRSSGRGGCSGYPNDAVRASRTSHDRRATLRSPCPNARRGGDSGKDTRAGLPRKAPSSPGAASRAGSRPRACRRPQRGSAAQLRVFAGQPLRQSASKAARAPAGITTTHQPSPPDGSRSPRPTTHLVEGVTAPLTLPRVADLGRAAERAGVRLEQGSSPTLPDAGAARDGLVLNTENGLGGVPRWPPLHVPAGGLPGGKGTAGRLVRRTSGTCPGESRLLVLVTGPGESRAGRRRRTGRGGPPGRHR
jgi:hypothetical protein